MNILTASLSQLLALANCSKYPIFVIFGASWKTRQPNYENLVRKAISMCNNFANEIILVESNGYDDVLEYVVNDLDLLSLPVLAVYNDTKVIFKLLLEDIIRSPSLYLSIMRYLSSIPIPSIIRDPSRSVIQSLINAEVQQPLLAYISGDKSQVGKTSVCLGILASLLKAGVPASRLGYIKPITQCEAEQSVTRFCKKMGIDNTPIGPVVFYKGMTRAFLNKEIESTEALLNQILVALQSISRGKLFVLVDGVGYPSVGSIVGLSNAQVAKSLNVPVMLVGKPGVGDAVDSYNLNATYFESFGVHVLGGVFNKLPLEGFYSLENSRESVLSYFQQYRPSHKVYGFIPMINFTDNELVSPEKADSNSPNITFEDRYIETFVLSFDTESFVFDVFQE